MGALPILMRIGEPGLLSGAIIAAIAKTAVAAVTPMLIALGLLPKPM